MLLAYPTQNRIPSLLHPAFLPPPGDLRKKRLAIWFAPEEVLHQLREMPLRALRKNSVAIALADLGIQEVAAECREHVERQHFGPHVAVVARAVAAGEVNERCRKQRALDGTERRFAFHALPQRQRGFGLVRGERHVVAGAKPLVRIKDEVATSAAGTRCLTGDA